MANLTDHDFLNIGGGAIKPQRLLFNLLTSVICFFTGQINLYTSFSMSLLKSFREDCVISNGDSTEQMQRSDLRYKYLLFLEHCNGKQVNFTMHGGKTQVEGRFHGCDYSTTDLYVKNLSTPVGVQENALLRSYDVVSFQVDKS